MAWVRVDDQAPRHHKMLKAGPAACWLWVCGLAYCQSLLTDGFIAHEALPTLGVERSVVKPLIAALVRVGLWDTVDGGYQVHDYHDYNDERAKALAKRGDVSAQRAIAGRSGGIKSGIVRREANEANGEANTSKQTKQDDVKQIKQGDAKQRSPIPSHPIPSVENERARDDSPLERATDAFRAHWKRVYGYESTLMLNHLQVMELDRQIATSGEPTFHAAMSAFFATDDPYVRKAKHPIGLFLREPSRFLAKDAAVTARPKGCAHQPPCVDAAAHTSRYLAEQRAS